MFTLRSRIHLSCPRAQVDLSLPLAKAKQKYRDRIRHNKSFNSTSPLDSVSPHSDSPTQNDIEKEANNIQTHDHQEPNLLLSRVIKSRGIEALSVCDQHIAEEFQISGSQRQAQIGTIFVLGCDCGE